MHTSKSKCTPGNGVQVVREHDSRSKPPTEWHRQTRKRPASQLDISGMLFMADLGYANDISLPGSTPEELQDLLNVFETAYCLNNALIINPSKCNIVVFSGGEPRNGEWMVRWLLLVECRSSSILA